MARVTTVGGWSQANDAEFRLWLAECEQMIADCGLVRTADTGQINPATATIPGSNQTDAGYSVWRFNDSLQSVAPVFVKIWYGRGGSSTGLRFGVQIGTGTDGAGNLTGVVATRAFSGSGATPGSGIYTSYAIHREGLAALAFKLGGASSLFYNGVPGFIVQRTCDNTGQPTAEGAVLIAANTSNSATGVGQIARLRFLPTSDVRDITDATWLGQFPGNVADSRVGLSPQVFTHWTALPEVQPLVGSCSYVRGEIGLSQQFSMALVGNTPRNYLAIGNHFGVTYMAASSCDTAILWED